MSDRDLLAILTSKVAKLADRGVAQQSQTQKDVGAVAARVEEVAEQAQGRTETVAENVVQVAGSVSALAARVEKGAEAVQTLAEQVERVLAIEPPTLATPERGPMGPMPAHKWEGTKLSFEKPEGGFGQAVDLKGEPGKPGKGGGVIVREVGGGEGGGGAVSSVAGRVGDVVLTADDVGLGQADNTPDSDKPISEATQFALDDLQGQIEAIPSPPVTSVAGKTGVVTLAKGDVGLNQVDDTPDATKPISAATQTALDAKADLVAGKVPSSQLPSYVDDVIEVANFASLPGTGETGKIYVALDTNKIFRWSGSAYVEISPSPGSTDAVTEGSTNLYFTAARVRAAVLTGLSTATSAVAAATDTVLQAIGKLQAQVNLWRDGPAFRARRITSDQSVPHNTATAIVFNTTDYDRGTLYNTTNGRWTPNVAGIYHLDWTLHFSAASAFTLAYTTLRKNGTDYARGLLYTDATGTSTLVLSGSTDIELNGTTDYVDVALQFTNAGAGSGSLVSSGIQTHFSGHFVRPA